MSKTDKVISKDDFMNQYAESSKVPLDRLKQLGFDAIPCDCDYEDCMGWQAIFTKKENL